MLVWNQIQSTAKQTAEYERRADAEQESRNAKDTRLPECVTQNSRGRDAKRETKAEFTSALLDGQGRVEYIRPLQS